MKKIVSLNGRWRFTPDLEVRPGNNSNLTEGYIYADARLSRKDWEWGEVPGVWNRYAEVYRLWEGVMWFCKEITLSNLNENQKARLRFEGVSYRADVFVNGKLIGTHESSYTEFTMDVTGYLQNGKNLITVRVDNRAMLRKWPCDRGYYCYGGIYRDVTLELINPGDFELVELTPSFEPETREGILRVCGNVYGRSNDTIIVSVREKQYEISTTEDGSFDETIQVNDVAPWSPETPTLYSVVLQSAADKEQTLVGFRSLLSSNGKIYLNGTPYHINGVCYVYDSPKYGLVMTRDQLEEDLREMKDAGVNAIRLHYAMNQTFYNLCDEIGFLVWLEPSVYCYHPPLESTNTYFTQPEYVENAHMIICEMIVSARKHCCVTFYGIGNECFVDHPEAEGFFTSLAELVRTLDNTRLVAYAALYGLVHRIGEVIDVIGLNSYYGWYDRITDLYEHEDIINEDDKVTINHPDLTPFHQMMEEVMERIPEDMPILLTEFGADSIPGNHSSSRDLWSEEYHAEVILETINASKKYDRVLGTFVFCFTDKLDPSKPRNGFWNYQNLKGMLSYLRDRKAPFYALQKAYGGKDTK